MQRQVRYAAAFLAIVAVGSVEHRTMLRDFARKQNDRTAVKMLEGLE